jgi:hypothetical protein
MRFHLSSLLLVVLLGAGCSSDTPAGPVAEPFWRQSKTGDAFLFASYRVDSVGAQITFPTEFDSTVVLQTGIRHGSDSNLVKIGSSRDPGTLYDFRSNGDIAIATLDYQGGLCWWEVRPIGSRQVVTIDTGECRIAANGLGYRLPGTIRYIGEENVTTPAGTFATHKILINVADDKSYDIERVEWYAPSLAMRVRMTSRNRRDSTGQSYVSELSSYMLK